MDLDKLKSLLTKNGYKITRQREIIFTALNDSDGKHVSPEELHEIVSKLDKDIGIATVYRTLQIFEDLGVAYKLDFDDNRYRYEIASEDEEHHHHHLICSRCKKVEEVKEDLLENVEEIIQKNHHFQIHDHNLKFYGLCSDCQKEEDQK